VGNSAAPKRGIPSHETLCDVIAVIDPDDHGRIETRHHKVDWLFCDRRYPGESSSLAWTRLA
jgi:hypothetical protein